MSMLQTGVFAEPSDVQALNPDIVVIATGGVPNPGFFPGAEDLATTTWDVLSGQVAVGDNVLFYDDEGGTEALSSADFIAGKAKSLEIVDARARAGRRCRRVELSGLLQGVLSGQGHDDLEPAPQRLAPRRATRSWPASTTPMTSRWWSGEVDQVIACHGALPADGIYFGLKDGSRNRGEIDQAAMIDCKPQEIATNPAGTYQLFRVGDAVASRNIHAAIYDSLRLCSVF